MSQSFFATLSLDNLLPVVGIFAPELGNKKFKFCQIDWH
jgi:hypothetical protein